MSTAYTPGLQVSEQTKIIKVRELSTRGRALVEVGQEVTSDLPVLTAELPGDLSILRLADRLGTDPELVKKHLQIEKGQPVERGQTIVEIRSFFGLFRNAVSSPVSGTVEFYTEANGHLGLRHPPRKISVNAYVPGRVVEVDPERSVSIECYGSLIQGIFGVGGERTGIVRSLPIRADRIVTAADLKAHVPDLTGAILVGGSQFDREAIQAAVNGGAEAIITGSIDAHSLREYVGYDIGVSITGDENVPLVLIITEGFGTLPISERILQLAQKMNGRRASVNGTTQVRAGAVRPELIIPSEGHQQQSEPPLPALKVGSRVRMIRVPYFGEFGTVIELPSEPKAVESGALVRVLRARLDTKAEVTVPRANVELVL